MHVYIHKVFCHNPFKTVNNVSIILLNGKGIQKGKEVDKRKDGMATSVDNCWLIY